jgi:hypothetical protein
MHSCVVAKVRVFILQLCLKNMEIFQQHNLSYAVTKVINKKGSKILTSTNIAIPNGNSTTQDRQRTYNVTLRRVRATIIAKEKQ